MFAERLRPAGKRATPPPLCQSQPSMPASHHDAGVWSQTLPRHCQAGLRRGNEVSQTSAPAFAEIRVFLPQCWCPGTHMAVSTIWGSISSVASSTILGSILGPLIVGNSHISLLGTSCGCMVSGSDRSAAASTWPEDRSAAHNLIPASFSHGTSQIRLIAIEALMTVARALVHGNGARRSFQQFSSVRHCS